MHYFITGMILLKRDVVILKTHLDVVKLDTLLFADIERMLELLNINANKIDILRFLLSTSFQNAIGSCILLRIRMCYILFYIVILSFIVVHVSKRIDL